MEKDESAPCRRVTTHGGKFFLTSDAFSLSRSQDVEGALPLFFLCFAFVLPLSQDVGGVLPAPIVLDQQREADQAWRLNC